MQPCNQKGHAGEETFCHKGGCRDEKSKAVMRSKSAPDRYRCLSQATQTGVYF